MAYDVVFATWTKTLITLCYIQICSDKCFPFIFKKEKKEKGMKNNKSGEKNKVRCRIFAGWCI